VHPACLTCNHRSAQPARPGWPGALTARQIQRTLEEHAAYLRQEPSQLYTDHALICAGGDYIPDDGGDDA
jgi:hypothetical protein